MQAWINFNPLPPHGGRLGQACPYHPHDAISIHSLRMEGDRIADTSFIISDYFNPLPPHGGRLCTLYMTTADNYFNPLPPHGGRQDILIRRYLELPFQSTPSAWRETTHDLHTISCDSISIHSLRMEGDESYEGDDYAGIAFQSTPSAWRETYFLCGF